MTWRFEERNGKPTKVPYQVNGNRAKSDDPQTWNTFEAVTDAWTKAPRQYQGIGFVFADADPFAGIDLDDCCMDQGGALKPWARPIIERFADTYMEVSPSGRGVKVWVKARLEGSGHRAAYQALPFKWRNTRRTLPSCTRASRAEQRIGRKRKPT
jgi:putative DNA primase/helicase